MTSSEVLYSARRIMIRPSFQLNIISTFSNMLILSFPQKRGVERRSLHYFPYRDDGYLLYHAIQRAVKDYVAE